MTSKSDAPDEELIQAHDLALAALREITPESTIGAAAGWSVPADGAVSLRFANTLDGYPGWFWTVTVARVEGEAPTVLEVELLPGDGALVAPDWVPWAVRLAEYHAIQEAAAAERAAAGESDAEPAAASDADADLDDLEVDELDDLDDLDAADFDEDGSPILHSGDVDGVDIDELADDDGEFDEPDDEEETDSASASRSGGE